MSADTAILLLNLGGPVTLDHVESFLYTLFSDRDLINLPGPAWFQPTYAWGIAKIRTKGAQQRYREIGGGSPLLRESAAQAAALRSKLREAGIQSPVKLVFRVTQPRAAGLLKALKKDGVTKLLPVTLYPHDCKATTGSSIRELEREAAAQGFELLEGVRHYARDDDYLDAVAEPIRAALAEHPYATVVFSAHSLPVKQIQAAGDPYEGEIKACVAALKQRVGEIPGGFVLAYQSRVGPIKWLGPNLRDVFKDFGGRDIIVVPISFVSEHIETLHELDIEYRHLAKQAGILSYVRVPTPGTHPAYIRCLTRRTIQALETGDRSPESGGNR
ncbi:MAG TPA: ferrochelatase [Holophagaceae bacterium]|nr:ferrochelatase [Holophagaceae bacterium]